MNHSNEQFNELIAQIIVHANKMLSESNIVSPFGILVNASSESEIMLAVDDSKSYSELLDALQESMKAKVLTTNFIVGCIVYADYEKNVLVAFLENIENYCLKIVIPVKVDKGLSLSADKMKAEEGGIFIFPVKQ